IRSDWEKAWEIRREHVLLRTNLDRDRADALASETEIAYGRAKTIFGKDPKKLPLVVYGFARLAEYQSYGKAFGAEHSTCYGAYLAVTDEGRPAACSLEDKNWASYFLAHAVGHAYVDGLIGGGGGEEAGKQHSKGEAKGPLVWFEEGIAAYVEAFYNKPNKD